MMNKKDRQWNDFIGASIVENAQELERYLQSNPDLQSFLDEYKLPVDDTLIHSSILSARLRGRIDSYNSLFNPIYNVNDKLSMADWVGFSLIDSMYDADKYANTYEEALSYMLKDLHSTWFNSFMDAHDGKVSLNIQDEDLFNEFKNYALEVWSRE